MIYEVIVSSPAEADIVSAFVWYEDKGINLGVDFIRCVDAVLAGLQRIPLRFPKRYGEFRMAMVPRFPYAVYFIVNEPESFVSVQAVLNFSQDAAAELRQR
jgi:plasmid stabilization system protein ParE